MLSPYFVLLINLLMFSFNKTYFTLSLILFFTEVLIAVFFHDGFIRPYLGDFLVVILLYCMIKSFLDWPMPPTVLAVLMFSYLVEILQFFNFVEQIGLGDSVLARTLIGTDFAWEDILAYTLGALTIVWVEMKRRGGLVYD